MCIYKPSPLLPNLLHMCTQPATCISVTLFQPTYLGYLLVHVGTSRVFPISHILLPWTFFWLRHIWVTFYLMSNLAGSHLGSDLFSDASTLTNRPQICRFKSKIYHQCFNSDWNILSCSRDRESEGQPVPNQRLREGAAHSTRGQRTSRHSFWKSLCTCKRTSRCEYNHPIIIQIICFSIPSLSFYLSHNFSQYLCFQEVAIYKYCSYCPSEIPIVTILGRKKDVFMNPAKVSVHCGKQEVGGGNFLSKLLRKNFEK